MCVCVCVYIRIAKFILASNPMQQQKHCVKDRDGWSFSNQSRLPIKESLHTFPWQKRLVNIICSGTVSEFSSSGYHEHWTLKKCCSWTDYNVEINVLHDQMFNNQ